MLDYFIRQAISHHALPWRIEQDWTMEVTDADNHVVLKCMTAAHAQFMVDEAVRIKTESDRTDKIFDCENTECWLKLECLSPANCQRPKETK